MFEGLEMRDLLSLDDDMRFFDGKCLEDGCDTVAVAKFDGVRSYKGQIWVLRKTT